MVDLRYKKIGLICSVKTPGVFLHPANTVCDGEQRYIIELGVVEIEVVLLLLIRLLIERS